MVSKGVLMESSSKDVGALTKVSIQIRPEMIPSFRLIAYYYHNNGEIVADSIWVDVKDECEGKVRPDTETDLEPANKNDRKCFNP